MCPMDSHACRKASRKPGRNGNWSYSQPRRGAGGGLSPGARARDARELPSSFVRVRNTRQKRFSYCKYSCPPQAPRKADMRGYLNYLAAAAALLMLCATPVRAQGTQDKDQEKTTQEKDKQDQSA